MQTLAWARAALFTNQIPAFEAAPSVYEQRAYFQMFADATANTRKYILLVTNTDNVLIFDLEDKIREDLLNLNVPNESIAMKRNILTVIVGAVLVVIFALLLFVFQVRQSETAVVTTFGKPVRDLSPTPGAYFKWPWPIQKVYKYDERVQNFEDKFSETFTADSITLLASVYAGWKISDAGAFLRKFPGDPAVSIPAAQANLESMLRSAKMAVIGGHTLSDFVNADPKELKFDAIENEIKQTVEDRVEHKRLGRQP